ncbi:623_t:CDS:1, partial [Cetraspora pellucida]
DFEMFPEQDYFCNCKSHEEYSQDNSLSNKENGSISLQNPKK